MYFAISPYLLNDIRENERVTYEAENGQKGVNAFNVRVAR